MDENDIRDMLSDIDSASSKSELKEILIDWRNDLTGEYDDDDEGGGWQYTLR